MASSTQEATSLVALLTEECGEVNAFVESLRQEQALLSSAGNVDALMPIVERKTAHTMRLKALSERREKLLAANGYETGRNGMEAWLTQLPGKAYSLWQELLSAAAEARRLNETNGKLINLHWQYNQAALVALLSATDRAMTYGPDGQQKGGGGGRTLGSA